MEAVTYGTKIIELLNQTLRTMVLNDCGRILEHLQLMLRQLVVSTIIPIAIYGTWKSIRLREKQKVCFTKVLVLSLVDL